MAYVAALGRPRGQVVGATAIAALVPGSSRNRGRANRLGWFASLAAALIVAVSGTALIVNAGHQSTSQALSDEIDALGDVARWTLRVDAQPDVRRIELASTIGTAETGSLVFSPSSTELVVVADHLAPAAAGHEYRCWVEVDGHRTPIGTMFFGGTLAYWVGDVPLVGGLAPGAHFGVSLVELGTMGAPGEPVLAGD